jgi:hypothetical protein
MIKYQDTKVSCFLYTSNELTGNDNSKVITLIMRSDKNKISRSKHNQGGEKHLQWKT